MKKVRLGNTGLSVSRIGLGGFPFGGVNKGRPADRYCHDSPGVRRWHQLHRHRPRLWQRSQRNAHRRGDEDTAG